MAGHNKKFKKCSLRK